MLGSGRASIPRVEDRVSQGLSRAAATGVQVVSTPRAFPAEAGQKQSPLAFLRGRLLRLCLV